MHYLQIARILQLFYFGDSSAFVIPPSPDAGRSHSVVGKADY